MNMERKMFPANQKVHIDRFERRLNLDLKEKNTEYHFPFFHAFIPSDVLIQKSEGYILEAPKVEKEAGKEEFAGPSMDNIIKGLAEAKQKEENFKKRQVGFVERAI